MIDNATTKSELFDALSKIDIAVPARIDGRTSEHTERWSMCRLLSTLAEHDKLKFPVSVTHRDKPDFLLVDGIDEILREIGVEVTEAISPQYAKFCSIAEREFPDAFLDPGHFRWGSPKLTTQQMRNLLREQRITSEGWTGDLPEEEWALFIESLLRKKLPKLAQDDYQIYPIMWLVIYDNLPLPNVHLERAISKLLPLISDCWSLSASFDAIYIEHGPVIAEITAGGTKHFELKDLWQR